jgi:polyisoprenoid-binding protein YceI
MRTSGIGSVVWALLLLPISWTQVPPPAVYNIDPARSRIELTVLRAGLLKMIGHDHAVAAKNFSGQVRFSPENVGNSSVQLSIDAGTLVVRDEPSVSESDRKQIQANMEGPEVLDIAKFPRITFQSVAVTGNATAPEQLMLRGRLNLHGVEKEIAFPVQFHSEANRLRVTGMAAVTQTEFGIKPIKVAAGGLRVKDQVNVKFEILAEKAD